MLAWDARVITRNTWAALLYGLWKPFRPAGTGPVPALLWFHRRFRFCLALGVGLSSQGHHRRWFCRFSSNPVPSLVYPPKDPSILQTKGHFQSVPSVVAIDTECGKFDINVKSLYNQT